MEEHVAHPWRDTVVFLVKEHHLKLLPRFQFGWDDNRGAKGYSYGAPFVSLTRPYGNSDMYGDIADLLGIDRTSSASEEYADEEIERMQHVHEEMLTVLQICVQNNGVHLGVYRRREIWNHWEPEEKWKEWWDPTTRFNMLWFLNE